MKKSRRLRTFLLAFGLVLGMSGVNVAQADTGSSEDDSGIIVSDDSLINDAEDPVVLSLPIPPPPGLSGNRQDFHIGFGTHIYVYLTQSDWSDFNGLHATAAAGLFCGKIGGTIAGVACGLVGTSLGILISRNTGPKAGQCAEVAYGYPPLFPVRYKVINKPCSKLR
ncbi:MULTISPECIES: hypothetical protein [unclassified Actinobaculum]|uniref:hypothetical protein n=1 Tax=unclassified Actinobaculum TaxID=2609299 RepID=UPI000D52A404|nr:MULTISPECIES: hypothetical protein [unclassified Actinobaculum]AWE42170.1 hypothetical protein DDD63_04715 [Actinobaculum sp. 313]RTE50730.1 hypothetical protein EKN07_00870 [Actinobaculum sp. 352]